MPKEKIYDLSELFDVEVGWAHGRDVQIGISTHDGRSLAEFLAGQGALEGGHVPPTHRQLDEPNDRHGYSTGTARTELPQFQSLWASLDRAGINRLIKMLRKARDDAYGRDE
jgi:hypothetical protein